MRDELNQFIATQVQENQVVKEQIAHLLTLIKSTTVHSLPTWHTPSSSPQMKIESPLGDVDKHTTSSKGDDYEGVEMKA